ncbi:MAG: hypothetical protein IK012_08045 [Fibrobacter sp.]|uniref:outer membrane protein n=1 Tax=Fibrobacter sp. TaxID=35828 RepID=UPI0025B81613|nr:hypothetical protein [Fibrobacter sp.]MBR4785188.1 hypothetical protein [Fibrobacter sp.]
MTAFIRTLVAIAAIFTVSTFAAEKVYMPPVGTTNIHNDYGIAAQKLMKTYIEDDGRFVLIVGTASDSVDIGNFETVKKKATEKGCSKILIAEFTRLGEHVILSFKLYNTSNESPIWQDRMKAANPDDFDPIIQRMARTVGTKEKATTNQDIYNVTEQENKRRKHLKAYSYFGVGLGGMLPLSPSVEMVPGIDIFGMYDTQSFLIGLDVSLRGIDEQSSYVYGDFEISAYYAFGRKFIAPYLGAGMNYAAVEYTSEVSHSNIVEEYDRSTNNIRTTTRTEKESYTDSKSGIGAFVGGGLMFNRASNIVLFLEAKYFVNFFKLTEAKREVSNEQWNDYYFNNIDLPSESNKLLQGFMFNLKIGYGF